MDWFIGDTGEFGPCPECGCKTWAYDEPDYTDPYPGGYNCWWRCVECGYKEQGDESGPAILNW